MTSTIMMKEACQNVCKVCAGHQFNLNGVTGFVFFVTSREELNDNDDNHDVDDDDDNHTL